MLSVLQVLFILLKMDAFSNGKTEEISKQLINLKGRRKKNHLHFFLYTLLSDEITDLSTFFKESFQRINSGIEDVRLNITENTLIIGKESTQPLVELKSLTTDMVSSVRDCDINFLHKVIFVWYCLSSFLI